MGRFESFKEELLKYLYAEDQLEKHDIEKMKLLTREDKIASDLMIANLIVFKKNSNSCVFKTDNNYSKIRSGDKVILKQNEDERGIKATIIDSSYDTITVTAEKEIESNSTYDLEIDSPFLLESLVGCLEGILPATPGAAFIRMLSGEEPVVAEPFLKLKPENIPGFKDVYSSLNEEQKNAVTSMLNFPPIHILQGPPGTGKTIVLSSTAIASSLSNRDVVIIANTHQAVNNALLKIHQLNPKIPLFKIGELLKAEELGNSVVRFSKFSEYSDCCRIRRQRKKFGHVVGMTIWGAISNLGLRTHSHFRPYIALVDEASLMPLTYASILGKCAASVCFFGDSRQMPPIFRTELLNNHLSDSILNYCANKVINSPICVLHETYRMNKDITNLISKSFYEPFGITLKCAANNDGNHFSSPYFDRLGLNDSVVFMNTQISSPHCREENEGEADAIVEMIEMLVLDGKKSTDIAVITPFRKQVRLLRAKAHSVIEKDRCPLIDTVERLQGQDVNCIIISFATSEVSYIKEMYFFLFNSNRLNVMISRAKTKVVIFGCEQVQQELKHILAQT